MAGCFKNVSIGFDFELSAVDFIEFAGTFDSDLKETLA